ncbi:MAG: hypothetical protein HYT68_00325 [Candidatus Zambryskibacteria bacterium]|nr:hypothetical protein [Candidatus Zambryskibacteria bacterium]
MLKKESILVVFGDELPQETHKYDEIFTAEKLKEFIEPGSIYEASTFVRELSLLKLPNGERLTKSSTYQGYELWWLYYNSIFTYFCLPYTQYKKLLEYLRNFENVFFYHPPYKILFTYYLLAYGCKVTTLRESGSRLHLGILIQVLITLLSIPVLVLKRPPISVFIGDKFEKGKDYDFRMRYVYHELRERQVSFVEFIRSLESWERVLEHFLVRKRPVIYSEAVVWLARFGNLFESGSEGIKTVYGDPFEQFKFLSASHYIRNVDDDIRAIKMMKWILKLIGVKSSIFTAALDRNYHTVFGCKLNGIPTVGILHGVASQYYNVYDFIPTYDGKKDLALDKYGVWSEWWRNYYVNNSKAYRPEQLYVSGPMRPLEKENSERSDLNTDSKGLILNSGSIKVLFVSEQLAVASEVIPYLERLLDEPNIKMSIIFRQYRDGFKDWLVKNNPRLLEHPNLRVVQSSLPEAINDAEVAVGTMSTAVLETLLALKIPVFFRTQKWGDYFNLKEYDESSSFFAENPDELVEKIKKVRIVKLDTLKDLQKRFFGDPYQNGSKWIVDQAISSLFIK